MARLIDADKVIGKIRALVLSPIGVDQYHDGLSAGGNYIITSINEGDFDPPKFSIHAVNYCIRVLRDAHPDSQNSPFLDLCDHLITYLDQLRESK